MNSLSQDEIKVLNEALDDEYLAWATYTQVIEDFGEIRPFINIREAEARHIEALCVLFHRYATPIPENPWIGKVKHYETVHDACLDGVEAEIENGEMYDRLLKMTDKRDILDVLRNLQDASVNRHLAAFRRCVERGDSGRRGRGRGQGRGCT